MTLPAFTRITLAFAALTAFITACGPQPQPTAPPTPALVPPNIVAAADWLLARQTSAGAITEQDDTTSPGQTALAALALTLAGRELTGSVLANLEALPSDPAAAPSDLARLVVFLQTTGRDPRAFGPKPHDLITLLTETCTTTDCGRNHTERAQILLAISRAGKIVPTTVIEDIARSQFSSGGWPYAFAGETESVRTTAWMIIALAEIKLLPAHQQRAINFLITRQRADGTWSNSSPTASADGEAGTTALALMALRVSTSPISPGVLSKAEIALLRFQQTTGGGFNYYSTRPGASVESTALAILALQGWPGHASVASFPAQETIFANPAWLIWISASALGLLLVYFLRRLRTRTASTWGKAR